MSIDLGAVRVGLALSDLSGTIATPHQVIPRTKDDQSLISAILALAEAEDVNEIIVGIPKSLKEENRLAEQKTLSFIEALQKRTHLKIVGFDERFTTVLAATRLRNTGLNSKTMKTKIDAAAAAEILQNYLDNRGNGK